ncbi:MAG: carboxymuconolactone decarboxylase family protein [Thermodesulfobacteriota bacterium]|nr:MAG: carboxymuconolactone decarboxylase family protein [Thermodesulfobacteriota bacterium]
MKADVRKELPEFLQNVIKRYPGVWDSFDALGNSIRDLPGGIDRKTQHLVKLGIAIGAGSEGAVHSHVRRAKKAGFTNEEIYHAALLSITTIGWPGAVARLSWIDDELKEIKAKKVA